MSDNNKLLLFMDAYHLSTKFSPEHSEVTTVNLVLSQWRRQEWAKGCLGPKMWFSPPSKIWKSAMLLNAYL